MNNKHTPVMKISPNLIKIKPEIRLKIGKQDFNFPIKQQKLKSE